VQKLNELARSAPPRTVAGDAAHPAGGLAAGAIYAASDDAIPRPGAIARALRVKIEQQTPILLAQLVAALVVFGFFYGLQRLIVRLLRGMFERTHADAAVSTLGVRFIRYTLLGVGVLAALQQLGVQVTSLLAGVGIAGLAVVSRRRTRSPT
jgi:small-conductance mechanosensitive channel